MSRANPILYTAIVMILFALLATPAGASTMINNQSDWLALTSGVTTITFEGLAPTSPTWYSTPQGLTVSGVNIVGVQEGGGNNLAVYAENNASVSWSGNVLEGPYGPGYVVATLPGGVTAVSTQLATWGPGNDVLVTLNGIESFTVHAIHTPTWVGFTSNTPITSIQFAATSSKPEIDNFSFGSFSPADSVPEPDTVFLGAIGLAGLWLGRRLRRFR